MSRALDVPVASPRDLAAALDLLRDATPDTRVLAGGTDLMVEFEIGRTRPDRVVDLWRVDELRGIAFDDDAGGLRVGALSTCTDLRREPLVAQHADILVDAARECGAVQIQNRATLGGNLGTASPAADLNPVLLALDAGVRLVSARGTREVPVAEFLTGYRATVRRPDELIHSVLLPARPAGERRAFRKVGTRAAQSIAKVVVALGVEVDGEGQGGSGGNGNGDGDGGRDGGRGVVTALRAAAGSVAERTVLLPTLAARLVGEPPTRANIERAARACAATDTRPVDDVRSTAHYRRTVLARILMSMLVATTGPNLK